VLEAQAMGCVCIVSDAEGLTENILDNVTGFVVQKRNPKLLYDKIVGVIDMDKITKLEIISNSVARLKSEFNLEIQKQKFIEFYKN
jgi:colanic acid/amylovoran biosynthesis glycosyltransferase